MIIFEKLKYKQISTLTEILSQVRLLRLEYVKSRFLRNASNFEITVSFLSELGLLSVDHEEVKIDHKCKTLFKGDRIDHLHLKTIVIERILHERTSFFEYVNDFLSRFEIVGDHYQYASSVTERLRYSGLRNLLIELGLLSYSNKSGIYIISNEYLQVYEETRASKKISLSRFLRTQRNNVGIGYEAELRVLEYEKQRLARLPHLVEKIQHMSVEDVTAGYDILSFQKNLYRHDNPIERFIEVKVVSPWDYRFYWTKNEIEKAKELRSKYYLYLLPTCPDKQFDFENLMVIRDPYKRVYENHNKWLPTVELKSFALSREVTRYGRSKL